jgi:hypothetical protein
MGTACERHDVGTCRRVLLLQGCGVADVHSITVMPAKLASGHLRRTK